MTRITESRLDKVIPHLTNDQRKQLREALKREGNREYLRTDLWYNYETQEWIFNKGDK